MRVMVPERLEEALSVAFATIAHTIREELPFSSTMHATMPIVDNELQIVQVSAAVWQYQLLKTRQAPISARAPR